MPHAACSGSLGFMTLILLPQHKTMSQGTRTDTGHHIKHAICLNKKQKNKTEKQNNSPVNLGNEVEIPWQ